MSTVECASCGASVPASSRFCPECGRSLRQAAATPEGSPLPRTPVPWGLVAAVLLAAAGVALIALGVWLIGLLLIVAAGAAFLVGREAERRRAANALGFAWEKAAAHGALVGARSRGQLDLFRLRRDLAELEAERGRTFHELGRAVYEGDEGGTAAARARLDDLSGRVAEKHDEMQRLVRAMERRVHRVRAQVAPTERLEAPPEPARVPEPFPPPDEGTPPEPARIPEPSPEPVPEPSPDDPAPEPEHPPTPQTRRRRPSKAKRG